MSKSSTSAPSFIQLDKCSLRDLLFNLPWIAIAIQLGYLLYSYRNGEAITQHYFLAWLFAGMYTVFHGRHIPGVIARQTMFSLGIVYLGILVITIYTALICFGGMTQLVLFQLFLIPIPLFLHLWTGRAAMIIIPLICSYILISILLCIVLHLRQNSLLNALTKVTEVTRIHKRVQESPLVFSIEGSEYHLLDADKGTLTQIAKDSAQDKQFWNFLKGRHGLTDALIMKDADNDSSKTTSIYGITADKTLNILETTTGTSSILSGYQSDFAMSPNSQWVALDKKVGERNFLLLINLANHHQVEIPDCGTNFILQWTGDSTLELLVSAKSEDYLRKYKKCSYNLTDQSSQIHAEFSLPSEYMLNTLRSESHFVIQSESEKLGIVSSDGSTSVSLPGICINRIMDWNLQTNTIVYAAEQKSGKQELLIATPEGIQDRLDVSLDCLPLNVSLSPDATKVLYIDTRNLGHPLTFGRIRLWNRKTGTIETIANLPIWETYILSELTLAWFQQPVWSPDSRSFTILIRTNNIIKKQVISTLYQVNVQD